MMLSTNTNTGGNQSGTPTYATYVTGGWRLRSHSGRWHWRVFLFEVDTTGGHNGRESNF